MDRFDTRLKAICEEFNHIEETAKEKVENKGRIIHIGKEVFYSDKSEEKKQAVFSGLINGGYISPTTSIDIFMGIFDETVFTRPVLWIKSQVSLMYFVYLSFRADNPFDFWTKCANCFQIREGKPINRESLRCNFQPLIERLKHILPNIKFNQAMTKNLTLLLSLFEKSDARSRKDSCANR